MPQRPSKPRVRVSVFLDVDQKRQLDKLSEKTRVPWSEYVREGVELVLKRRTRR